MTSIFQRFLPMLLAGLAACAFLEANDDGLPFEIPVLSPAEASVPDSVRDAYRTDAVRLYLRELGEDHADQPVEVPESGIAPFLDALLRVYRADIPARDTVVKIRTFPTPAVHELIVAVEEDAAWTQAWAEGRRLTGNPAVDELMDGYDLQLKSYRGSPSRFAVLRSEEPLNLRALGARFAPIEGVRYAEPNGYAGDGADIEATVGNRHIDLAYSIGWGDCPAGCIHRKWWTFRVLDSGAVLYLGTRER